MELKSVLRKIAGAGPARAASRREKIASLAVMVALAVVAAGVAVRQASFNEAVLESLKVASGVSGAAVGEKSGDILARLPAGLEVMSPAESFNRETLSDKINGRAELYLPAGFVGLRAQRIRFVSGSSAWLEVYVYDMGGARGAFSVYSTQRREEAPSLKFAKHGYRTANALSFVRGGDYIDIIASGTGKEVTEAMLALGEQLAAAGGPDSGGQALGESEFFPAEGREGVQLVAKNAFSFGKFDNVFVAQYRDGGKKVYLFLSRRGSAEEAAGLAAEYRKFLLRLGGEESSGAEDVAGSWLVGMDGSFEGAFSSGLLLAGVHQVETGALATKWMKRLSESVREKAR